MDSVFIKVSTKDRLPSGSGFYLTNNGHVHFLSGCKRFMGCDPQWWLEEYSLETIKDKRELTATFFVNSIRLLDEQGARHLVKELCERFHLLPSEEDINWKYPLNSNELHKTTLNVGCRTGANYILNTLKGEKSNG